MELSPEGYEQPVHPTQSITLRFLALYQPHPHYTHVTIKNTNQFGLLATIAVYIILVYCLQLERATTQITVQH